MSVITSEELERQKRNEENTKLRLITPEIQKKWGYDLEKIQMEYTFTAGKISLDDGEAKRGEPLRADYLLLYKNNIPLALVEAKGEDHSADEGRDQVIKYAMILDVPFAYSTNGHELIEKDMITGEITDLKLDDFPMQNDLWNRYIKEKVLSEDEVKLLLQPYYQDTTSSKPKEPRYYQRIAINKTIEAVAKNQNRLLLVMATGTGKTFTAFQIMWRLYKSGSKKKMLYLVDRNILADQSITKDFKPFNTEDPGAMIKIKNDTIDDSSHSIYFALYQQLKSKDNKYYEKLPKDFFDLIIVDECHRGSANEDSSWREILDYFGSAIQLGLTATPKEDGVTTDYFGEPIYTYSLKNGINDGFLAPYQVVTIGLNIDKTGYQAHEGEIDEKGNKLEEKLYEAKSFDRFNGVAIKERRDVVAKKISDYMKENDCRYAKTIVFCETIEHAQAMTKRLVNENLDLVKENPKYVVQITGDNDEGKAELDNFVDPSSKYPVIAVTSELMSTGVDSETCKLIVLDKSIGSMTEFKQIVGRGTRIKEKYNIDGEEFDKLYFTVLDFRENYLHFQDPAFDGVPISITTKSEEDTLFIPSHKKAFKREIEETKNEIAYVSGVKVEVDDENVYYRDESGKLTSENLVSCARNNILEQYPTVNDFEDAFMKSEDKLLFTNDLLITNKLTLSIQDDFGMLIDGYDIVRYIGYKITPISKEDRMNKIYKNELFKSQDTDKQIILKVIINQYNTLEQSFGPLKTTKAYQSNGLSLMGYSPQKINKIFVSKKNYIDLMNEFEKILYDKGED